MIAGIESPFAKEGRYALCESGHAPVCIVDGHSIRYRHSSSGLRLARLLVGSSSGARHSVALSSLVRAGSVCAAMRNRKSWPKVEKKLSLGQAQLRRKILVKLARSATSAPWKAAAKLHTQGRERCRSPARCHRISRKNAPKPPRSLRASAASYRTRS